jgi:hypothetical protein
MSTISKCLTALTLLSGPVMVSAQAITIDSIGGTLQVAQFSNSSGTITATDVTSLTGLSATGSASLPYVVPAIPEAADISLSYSLDVATGVFSAGGTTFGCNGDGPSYLYTCNGSIALTFTTTGVTSYTLQEPVRVFNDISGIPGGTAGGGCSLASCSYTLGAGTYTLDLQTDLPLYDGQGVVLTFAQPVSVAAPELDPASAASGLTLLVGSMLVLGGRRKLQPAGQG